jgi:hypothetical protein
VRPLKAAPAPLAGSWPDSGPPGSLGFAPNSPPTGTVLGAPVSGLPAAVEVELVAAAAAVPDDVALVLWIAAGRLRVLWSTGSPR